MGESRPFHATAPGRLGAGGPVGSGRQYWPWIHRQDWIGLVRFAIEDPAVSGPLNGTAPNPLPNAEFARTLGRAIRRQAFMPTPGFALKLLLGELAEGLLLSGQRAIPAKTLRRPSGLPTRAFGRSSRCQSTRWPAKQAGQRGAGTTGRCSAMTPRRQTQERRRQADRLRRRG